MKPNVQHPENSPLYQRQKSLQVARANHRAFVRGLAIPPHWYSAARMRNGRKQALSFLSEAIRLLADCSRTSQLSMQADDILRIRNNVIKLAQILRPTFKAFSSADITRCDHPNTLAYSGHLSLAAKKVALAASSSMDFSSEWQTPMTRIYERMQAMLKDVDIKVPALDWSVTDEYANEIPEQLKIAAVSQAEDYQIKRDAATNLAIAARRAERELWHSNHRDFDSFAAVQRWRKAKGLK